MLIDRLSLPKSIGSLFAFVDERWDGKGQPGAKGEEIPLAMRIAHVARDIDVQRVVGGAELAARIVGEHAGGCARVHRWQRTAERSQEGQALLSSLAARSSRPRTWPLRQLLNLTSSRAS